MRKAFVYKISKNYEFEANFLEKFVIEVPLVAIARCNCSKISPGQSLRSEEECAPVTPLYKRDTIVLQKRKAKEKLMTGIQTKFNVL